MRKTKLMIIGATGRMGKEVIRLAKDREDFHLSVAISRTKKCQDFDITHKNLLSASKKDVDLIIDFSTVEQFANTVNFAKKNKIPLVSGVTGISKEDGKLMKLASIKTAILWAPNMSVGVAVLKKAIHTLEPVRDFDFQILEAHHVKKRDAPSGTALMLQEALERTVRKKINTPLAIRGGGIIGEHEVMAMSEEEIISFKHSAIHRSVFAKGALRAASWLMDRSNGLFTMEDVVGDG